MRIKWTGPEREVPTLGLVKTGDKRDVPDHVGKSLIYQGLAVEDKPKSSKGGES